MFSDSDRALNASISFKNSYHSILPKNEHIARNIIEKELSYPVIMCNDFNNLYKINVDGNNNPEKIKENFQLEINYAYLDKDKNNQNKDFLIDIVNFEFLNDFLEKIKKDIEAVMEKIILDIGESSFRQRQQKSRKRVFR